jgi:hypothetical protein
MIKLKNILSEGFAWERKEGKGLPTLAEVQAEYEANEAVSQEEAQDKVSSRTHVVYACNVELADGTIKPGVRISVPKGDNAEQQVRDKIQDRFGKDSKIRAIAKAQNPHINDNDKDDEPRWQDNDGDGKWYEKGDDVKENVNESFVGRLKKNFIGGATRK